MARAVEDHKLPLIFSWKALTDVVEKREEEASGILQLQELAIRFFTSPRTQNPALGGETLLQNLLIHHPTLNEVRQEWRGAEATIALCMESLKRSVLGAHNCALSPFYILMTRYSSQIFFSLG